ncbi:MAG TPA: glycoside hydrolase family 1 protein [Candidatus Saccharimonadales bacterium]|nr:glycoside hydrolase family 1 protein [Candidatus Saccharimonadales bacterium]
MQQKPRLSFPKNFFWGAASSAHQVEGGTHNQWTVWELENAKAKAAQAPHQWGDLDSWDRVKEEATDPGNYVSGRATDHYHLYEDDFDLIEKLNMNMFRFSVEWSRIEPREGAWNVEAIDHYKEYIAELRRRGIEPMLTLFHFTLPTWFTALGGFEKRSNVKYFVRFAEKILRELGSSVKYVITINEPVVYANESYLTGSWTPNITNKVLFFRVLNNLIYAHNQTAQMIHGLGRRYKVSVAKNSIYYYAGDDSLLSRKTADVLQYAWDDYFLRRIRKNCDWLGVNYYFSYRVYGYRVHNPNEHMSDLGWDLSPVNIEFALERLYEKYGLPIIITENGLADSADEQRQWWITQTLIGMQRALDNGVRLEGYLHWSLTDNFEWDRGIWPRFGLAAVDYKTQQRTLRPSALWFGKIIKHLRGL